MYSFTYFSPLHLETLLGTISLLGFLIWLPRVIPVFPDKGRFYMGCLILVTAIGESVYRINYEGFSWGQIAPLHFCSISVFMAGLFLIQNKECYFQITYYFSFGAFLALLLPGIESFRHPIFFWLFMVTHGYVLFTAAFGMIWLGKRPSKKGLVVACKLCLGLFGVSFLWNSFFFTNFMFTKNYIVPWIAFIQPFILYQGVLILAFMGIMYAMYCPFKKRDR